MEPKISRREAEVLAAIDAHLVNAEIAAELGISVRTVETHVSALLRKFGVADRRALARASAAHRQVVAPGDGTPADAGFRLPGAPVRHTSFIGRAHEVDAAVPAVREPGLVTLVGPGGVGKTRLASVVAEHAATMFGDGGAYVDLVPAAPAFAVQTVAAALGVAEVQHQPLEQSIAAFLAERHALLVLDNCEHALSELAPLVERVLAAGPRVSVLATSRERLGLPGERVLRVGPLPLASEAEALFTDRARAADEHFAAEPAVVAAICARLDGLPLAIELAAARAAALGPRGLLAALDDVLQAVSGGRSGDRRHTSLRAVIEWSHRLLSEPERRLFAELAVFRGGFDLRAVTAVAGERSPARVADVLGRLADKCLVLREEDGERWRMLRTVRAFADDQLDDEQRAPLRRRHLGWAAERAESLLTAARDHGAAPEPGWIAEFDVVVDDLRAALAAEAGAAGRRLAWALARLAYARRLLRESVAHFRRAAELAGDDREAAVALRAAGHATFAIDRAERAYELFLASAARAGTGRDAVIGWCEALLTALRFPSGFSKPVTAPEVERLLADAAAALPPDDVEATAYLDAACLWADPMAFGGAGGPGEAFCPAGRRQHSDEQRAVGRGRVGDAGRTDPGCPHSHGRTRAPAGDHGAGRSPPRRRTPGDPAHRVAARAGLGPAARSPRRRPADQRPRPARHPPLPPGRQADPASGPARTLRRGAVPGRAVVAGVAPERHAGGDPDIARGLLHRVGVRPAR